MTDAELKELVAGLAVAQADTDRLLKESAREADRRWQEADRRRQEFDRRHEETEALLEGLARKADRRHEETEALLKELAQKADRRSQEADRRSQEADRRSQEADRRLVQLERQIKTLGDNIGGLSNKFGRFTEALAYPSMEKLLTEKFGMDFVGPDITKHRGRQRMQVDVLAYANTERNAVFVIEVKSRLKEEGLDQIRKILADFFVFFPEHRGKELYGMLAVVEAPDDLLAQAIQEGIYTARISDDIFQLEVPEDSQPHSFSEPPASSSDPE